MVLYDLSTMPLLNNNYPVFSDRVLGKAPFVMLVYADWCGHCQNMSKAWNDAVAKTSRTSDIVHVEESVYSHLNAAHPNNTLTALINKGIRGYPFLAIVSAEGADGIDVAEQNTSDQAKFESVIKSVSKASKASKTSKTSKASKAPKSPKASKASKAPKSPKTSKTSKTSKPKKA